MPFWGQRKEGCCSAGEMGKCGKGLNAFTVCFLFYHAVKRAYLCVKVFYAILPSKSICLSCRTPSLSDRKNDELSLSNEMAVRTAAKD